MSGAARAAEEPIDAVYGSPAAAPPARAEARSALCALQLRASLRSLQRFAPWIRRVVLVAPRAELPAWLEISEPSLRLVPHEEIFAAEQLPNSNPLALAANLDRIPGLSRRFLLFAGNPLLGAPLEPLDLLWPDGAHKLYFSRRRTPPGSLAGKRAQLRGDAPLALCNALLDDAYGHAPRPRLCGAPLLCERDSLEACASQWKREWDHTRASRSPCADDVAPDFLYAWFLCCEGGGRAVPRLRALRSAAEWRLDHRLALQRAGLAWLRLRPAKFVCLKGSERDDLGPAVAAAVRRFLEQGWPWPSRFERPAGR